MSRRSQNQSHILPKNSPNKRSCIRIRHVTCATIIDHRPSIGRTAVAYIFQQQGTILLPTATFAAALH
jgi:hypothetical protein